MHNRRTLSPPLASSASRSFFISRMQTSSRELGLISSSTPLSQRRSLVYDASADDVVVERRWSWSSVTESDELVGRMREVLRLPQYWREIERNVSTWSLKSLEDA